MSVFGFSGVKGLNLRDGRQLGISIGVELQMAVEKGEMTKQELANCLKGFADYLATQGILLRLPGGGG